MDFETIILRDALAIEFLMKNPELIRFGFDIEDECPQKFLLRKVNAGPANAQNSSRKSYSLFPIAISRRVKCSSCQGTLKIKKCIDSTIFDDVFGKVHLKIITKYCKACKSTVYPGFQENQIEKTRLYDTDWDSYKIFVSTHCTVYSIDHLRRFAALKQKCHVTFYGRAEAYNYQHGYSKKTAEGSMDHRRLIEAYFKYIYLEFRRRHNQPLLINGNIFDDIHAQYEDMYYLFQQRYSAHVCDVPGCKSCILIDGHMKAHRKVCAVKTCKNDPKLQSIYCSDHAEKPLRELKMGAQELKDEEYHVERILSKKYVKKQWLFEVKWKGFDETTFEPKENLPRVLVEFFEIYGNSAVPSEINSYFEKGGIKYVNIKVQNEILKLPACALEVNEKAYYIPSPDHVSCDTNKSKKRFYHRTGGILVMGRSCGVVTHVEEIFGAEGITNVAEMVEKALVELGLPTTLVLYDDACHLKRHVGNREKVYPELSKRDMKVDRFHFPNHVDPWCKENMDPYKCDQLLGVNTEKMEQFFAWLKGFAGSLKYMKRSTFNFLLLDLIDRHNEEIINGKSDFDNVIQD